MGVGDIVCCVGVIGRIEYLGYAGKRCCAYDCTLISSSNSPTNWSTSGERSVWPPGPSVSPSAHRP